MAGSDFYFLLVGPEHVWIGPKQPCHGLQEYHPALDAQGALPVLRQVWSSSEPV